MHNHHRASDGRGIALDDMQDIARMQRRREIWQELFQNAARIGHAARSNAWLRPLFRKYKEVCREILDQKKKEITAFTKLCDDCHMAGDKHQMKLIRDEMGHIHAQIQDLEDMPLHKDNDSDDSSDMSTDNEDNKDNEDNEDNEDHNSVHSSSSSSSSSTSSSSSSSSLEMDLEDFM